MGFTGFGYETVAEVFSEHAALSAFENNGTRAMDIGAFAGMSNAAYETMLPFQWPKPRGMPSASRMFGDGKFFTESGRAAFVATPFRRPKGKSNPFHWAEHRPI
jgi:assimilatory nitrate reductase catalytic subunit